jgi:Holliday junction resolvase RusA-like endonuclease
MMTLPINKPTLDTSPAGLQDPFGSKTTKTKKHQSTTMPPYLTKKCDADAIMAGTAPNYTLHLTVSGPPSVQERARIRYQPFAGKPRVYDPSRKGKIAFRDAVKASIQDLDFVDVPVFKAGQTLRLNVVFGLTRQGKDVDNLLKFVMDALQGVLYRNDAIVWKSNIEKRTVPKGQEYTHIFIEEVVG